MATARENTMRPLLAVSAAIDLINEKIGYVCNFLVLAACIVSAGNAMIRYAFGYSSNGWLELQWYMFAILVMFGASYTFKRNEHVRVEIFYLFLSERGQLWLDLIGTLFFLIPACLLLAYLSWPFFYQNFLQAIPGRVFGSVLANDLLLAIPFFTFMGAVLERCGLAEDMLDSMGQLFGPIRGGLGYSVIIVGFILGAITGTVAAQVIAMAMISMPVMIRYGYNIRYITGVLAASGTITQLVPPSLVLIVLADQLGKSVGDMYLGAWGPSVFQIMLFAGYTFILGLVKPEYLPPVPKTALTLTGWPLWQKCLLGIIPSAVLIFVVLGTMMLRLATPTETRAIGPVRGIVVAP